MSKHETKFMEKEIAVTLHLCNETIGRKKKPMVSITNKNTGTEGIVTAWYKV